jgi:hypothetical protein
VFTRALHLSLSWASSIQSIPPHSVSLRTIWILLYVRSLLGNVLVNKFPRKQILGNQSVASLRNNGWGCVFYIVRTQQRENNGIMQTLSEQQLGEYTCAQAVTSAAIETVFSMGSVQTAYKRSECSDRISSRAVTRQS